MVKNSYSKRNLLIYKSTFSRYESKRCLVVVYNVAVIIVMFSKLIIQNMEIDLKPK